MVESLANFLRTVNLEIHPPISKRHEAIELDEPFVRLFSKVNCNTSGQEACKAHMENKLLISHAQCMLNN